MLLVATAMLLSFPLSVSNPLQAQAVKIKHGKATMSEEYYNSLKTSADNYIAAQAKIEELNRKIEELNRKNTPPVMRSFIDSASYAIGRDVYGNWTSQRLGINGEMAGQAMKDDAHGFSQLSDAQARPLLQRFQQQFEQNQRAGVQENIDKGAKFMKEISNNKSVYTTKSGLKYRKIKDGNGKRPKSTDRVKVHYTGSLIDGTKFDSSVDRGEPLTFQLNQVIPGWTEGLQLMDEGAKYMLYIPYNLGYGEQQVGNIPAGSTLIFEVELIEINPK